MNDPKYDLLTDSCFFEFLPMDGTGDEAHPLTMDQLTVGKEYEVIITNLSGFCRYRIKDVIHRKSGALRRFFIASRID